jgi:hypothetical protein
VLVWVGLVKVAAMEVSPSAESEQSCRFLPIGSTFAPTGDSIEANFHPRIG